MAKMGKIYVESIVSYRDVIEQEIIRCVIYFLTAFRRFLSWKLEVSCTI